MPTEAWTLAKSGARQGSALSGNTTQVMTIQTNSAAVSIRPVSGPTAGVGNCNRRRRFRQGAVDVAVASRRCRRLIAGTDGRWNPFTSWLPGVPRANRSSPPFVPFVWFVGASTGSCSW